MTSKNWFWTWLSRLFPSLGTPEPTLQQKLQQLHGCRLMLERDSRRYGRQVEELEREKQRCFHDGMGTKSVTIRRIQAGLIAAIDQRIGFKQKLSNLIERQVHLLHCQASQFELMIEMRAHGLPSGELTEGLLQQNQLEFRQLHEDLEQANHQQAAWEADVLPLDSNANHSVGYWLNRMAQAETLPTVTGDLAATMEHSPQEEDEPNTHDPVSVYAS